MGIADVRDAFQRGLGSSGTCMEARMDYELGGATQVLTFVVPGRDPVKISVSAGDDLMAAAEAAGRGMAST